MSTYSLVLMFLTLLCIYILAHLALKHLRISDLLRQICKNLIVSKYRAMGKEPTEEEVEDHLLALIELEEIKEGA